MFAKSQRHRLISARRLVVDCYGRARVKREREREIVSMKTNLSLAAMKHDASRRGATTCSMTFPFDDCNKWGPPPPPCSLPRSPKPFYHRQPLLVSHSTSGQIIQRGAAISRKIGIFARAAVWPVIGRSIKMRWDAPAVAAMRRDAKVPSGIINVEIAIPYSSFSR